MSDQLRELKPLHENGAERALVFPSKTSLDWILRQHKHHLVDAGALLMIAGRWSVLPEKFDGYVLEEGRRAATARSSRESAV